MWEDTRDVVAEMHEKHVFLSYSKDFPLIVRFKWGSSQRPVRVPRKPAGADRKPKETQWFPTVPFVGVDFRGAGSCWTFLDRRRPLMRNHSFSQGFCRFIDNCKISRGVFFLKSVPLREKACFSTVSEHSWDANGGGFFLKDSLLTVLQT